MLEFEGIRCFSTKQRANLPPLTLLVGENSSGKTTFLALCRLASDIVVNPMEPRFNEPPFLLGSFEQIASQRASRAGAAKSFSIGFRASEGRITSAPLLCRCAANRSSRSGGRVHPIRRRAPCAGLRGASR